MPRVLLALATVALLAAATPGSSANGDGRFPGPAAPTTPAAPDTDLWQIRNIFRYADRTPVEARPGPSPPRPSLADPAEELEEGSRVRLVGLVKKGGRPVAALSIDGEVVVLAEGESSGGVTVIAVDGEAVSLRGPEGGEETLIIP
jgi:hypothetical protein